MITMRSRFYKKDDMVFISHLDLVRLFERAIRRANIPVAYTQGFNPRPIMAFATALGIGVASEGEYIDIQLNENIDSTLFMDKLNNVLPEGLKIIKSVAIHNKVPSLMSIVKSSTYLVKLKTRELLDEADIKQCIQNILNEEVIIEVRQKKQRRSRRSKEPKLRQINIRPFIKDIQLFSLNEYEVILKMHLLAGSEGNLKPEVVIDKLYELTNLPINMEETRVHRLDLFVNKDNKLITPLDEEVWNI